MCSLKYMSEQRDAGPGIALLGDPSPLLHISGGTGTFKPKLRFRIVGVFYTGEDALAGVVQAGYDGLLVVSELPDMTISDLCRRLHCEVPILGVYRAGGAQSHPQWAHWVDVWLSESVCVQMLREAQVPLPAAKNGTPDGRAMLRHTTETHVLTPREEQVATLLSRGKHDKEIAKECGIALPTVKVHVHRILGKLGLRGRVDLNGQGADKLTG